MPEDLQLSEAVRDAADQSDLDEGLLKKTAWVHGDEEVLRYLEAEREARLARRDWLPKLLEIASLDRQRYQRDALPMGPKQQEMLRVLKRVAGGGPEMAPWRIAICTLPAWAIGRIESDWEVSEKQCVTLSPEATEEWNRHYRPADDYEPWWYSDFSWLLDDSPSQREAFGHEEFSEERWKDTEVPEGCEPWLLSRREQHGPLFGRGETGLWLWDGNEASYVRRVNHWVS